MSTNAIEDIYPLSPLQQGMLFHSLCAPQAGQHLLQLCCTLAGAVERGHFEAAWVAVVKRHPTLRTSFAWDDLDEPLQIVHRTLTLPTTYLDWTAFSPSAQQRALEDYLAEDRLRGFALDDPPLMRLLLARTGPASHLLVWSCHHLLLDGWSLGLVLDECLAVYDALSKGETATPRAARPYRDYIAWLKQQPLEPAERYWRERLRGMSAPPRLPVLRGASAPRSGTTSYGRLSLALSPETSAGLRALARAQQITLNTVFQGAWALLLSRYTGERDVLFGTTVAGRPATLPEVESIVGMFINTQPVRATIDPNARLVDWLHALQRDLSEAYQFEHCSLVDVQAWSELPRGQELFDTLLVFESFPRSGIERALRGGFAVRDLSVYDYTNYTLDIDVVPGPAITLLASYDRERLDEATVTRLLGHYAALLGDMLSRSEERLGMLSILSDQDKAQILVDWNERRADYPVERSIQALFEEQVERSPDAIAVAHNEVKLSYRELNCRANRVAHRLIAEGVGPDVVVGLLAARSIDFLTAILGVLKAGGAYLPLDPEHPRERLVKILLQSRPLLLLAETALARSALVDGDGGPRLLDLEALLLPEEELPEGEAHNPPQRSHGANLAYLIFTSGSTGAPKGAMLEHRGKINHMRSMIDFLGLGSEDVMAQTASQCFDISVWQFLAPLLVGARVEIIESQLLRDLPAFLGALDRSSVTVLEVVPSQLLAMLETLEELAPEALPLQSLRWIIPNGEVLPPELCRRWLRLLPGCPLVNAYGPTETSDDTNLHLVASPPHADEERIPIGHAIANATMYILDGEMRPVPVGVPGELYIGGVCVGRGYVRDPARTASVYVPDPFSNSPGARLYKTGDRCRFLPDGNIDFLDRCDFQVKIRGYRIEPGEVEAALFRHPAVKQAAVVARDDLPGGKQLVAYVALEEGAAELSSGDDAALGLRAFVQQHVPPYMVPAAIVALPQLPLNANGKIDRRALPRPERSLLRELAPAIPPRTETEARIVAIWEEVLEVAPIGVEDDFFERGGHSILAIQVHSRLRGAFAVDLPLRLLFELTTPFAIAQHIEAVQWAASGAERGDSSGKVGKVGEEHEEHEEIEL